MTFTEDEVWEAVRFASRVADLGDQAPNDIAKEMTIRFAKSIVRHFASSHERKARLVLSGIRNGCNKYQDLERETGFSATEVRRLVKRLESIGRVKSTPTMTKGKGRPWKFLSIPDN